MNLNFDKRKIESYSSSSQKVRVLSEDWVNKEAYCPNCGNTRLNKYANSKPVADFFCGSCKEDFELKSKKDSFGTKIVDGGYKAMLKRLAGPNNPNLFLLNYDFCSYQVSNFLLSPSIFLLQILLRKGHLYPRKLKDFRG